MNITTKLDHISSDFITQYLTALGIEDVKRYLRPTKKNYESHWNYAHIEEACEIVNWYITNHAPIGVIVDSDMDGACSGALIYNFLTTLGVEDVKVYFHEGKQHGIKDKLDEIIATNGKNSLLIVPDAGSNDVEECKALGEATIEVVILDHHIIETPNPFATVVNNQTEGVTNKALSGTGVTDKFVRAYCEKYNITYPNYSDLTAVSLVTDVCDLSTLENRWYLYNGLKNIINPFLAYLFEKCCKYRGYTPEAIGWDIGPLGNALARSDEQESKTLFFDGLIGKVSPEEALKEIRKVKRIQDDEVKSIVGSIEPTLDTSNKAIIGFVDAESASYTGLIANKFNGKYNKPSFLLRDTGHGSWSGSMRSPVPLATKINESGIASAQGHEEACGILVKKKNFDEFVEWLNSLDLSEKPDIEVTAKVNVDDITLDICQSIESYKQLWGKGVEAPTFAIDTIITQDNISVYEKSTTTIKLVVDGVSFIKFRASSTDVEAFKKHNKFAIRLIVGSLGVNEWEGVKTPQCVIEDYEINEIENEVEDWSESF